VRCGVKNDEAIIKRDHNESRMQ